ncbi:hypothetical protein BAE44_0001802 [Dichanthelium oligosanthes]|uniref:CUE domain-containing protein n=1 Tax=Dichanthelium oligosanthes TaxID=888268 RepID=A0A1E5WIF0_9POAL|nr:hypothetical protein BAE44_0001802 [Dichanthelium oligosanthes]
MGMAATVVASRKRGTDAFLDDDPFAFHVDLPVVVKRGRCSAPTVAADLGLSFPLEYDPVEALQLIFPGADAKILREYLQASGNVLDAAIRAYKDYLANISTESSSITYAPSDEANDVVPSEVDLPVATIPTSGSEWAELIVKELSSAPDLVDAKNRAFRIFKLLERSAARASPDEKGKVHKEHKIVKQMLGGLLHQNGVLKRAFLIQHNRLKEYQEMVQEQSQFNQIVEKYQQQIKALEVGEELCLVISSSASEPMRQHLRISQSRRLLTNTVVGGPSYCCRNSWVKLGPESTRS